MENLLFPFFDPLYGHTKGRIKFNQAKKAAILISNEASILIPKKEKKFLLTNRKTIEYIDKTFP